MPVGCGLRPRMWRWHLDVVRYSRVRREGSWKWLVSPCLQVLVFGCGLCQCVSVADVCGWLPKRVAMADDCGWLPRVWRWRFNVFGAYVCGHGNWM